MNKMTREEIYTRTRDELRSKDHTAIKVNGFETTVSEYYQNPQGFNTAPMDKKFIEQIERDHQTAVETKKRLQTNPASVKALE